MSNWMSTNTYQIGDSSLVEPIKQWRILFYVIENGLSVVKNDVSIKKLIEV